MAKFGAPEARKPMHLWFDEGNREVLEKIALKEKKLKEIDTTSEIRRMDRPEDLDIQGWKSL